MWCGFARCEGVRKGPPFRPWRQGYSSRVHSQPNPRLQAPRPGARMLGGMRVTHHRAMSEATAVVGARLKRSVRLRKETMALVVSIWGALAIGAVRGAAAPAGGGWKEFDSRLYGFHVLYPGSWYFWEPKSEVLEIFNFPRSQGIEGVILPLGGASISVMGPPPDIHIRSLDEWVQRDLQGWTLVDKSERIVVPGAPRQGCARLTKVVSVADQGPPGKAVQVTTAYYCRTGGGLYRIEAINWRGDPNQEQYQELAFEVATTLRAASR